MASVAQRILAALREPMHVEDLLIHITGSIGIATFPGDGDHPDELITRADLAMYAAKNAGGDRYLQFSAELGSEAMDRAQLRHDLARAVLDGEFELAYQPIVALESGAVAGVEALARWRHHGQLDPAAQFMAFAERTGQIVAIGRLILEVVERDIDQVLATLPADGFLAINLSARELADDQHLDRLLAGPLQASRRSGRPGGDGVLRAAGEGRHPEPPRTPARSRVPAGRRRLRGWVLELHHGWRRCARTC